MKITNNTVIQILDERRSNTPKVSFMTSSKEEFCMENLLKKEKMNQDESLFYSGEHYFSYRFLGSHLTEKNGEPGVLFRVWAPHAKAVSVVGDFNRWNAKKNPMRRRNGFWSVFIKGLTAGCVYKYSIETAEKEKILKSDPYAVSSELRPNTASVVYPVNDFLWCDDDWMQYRKTYDPYHSPMNIYELHLGSWKRDKELEFANYSDIADKLIPYLKQYSFTHVEIMPVTEHPFDGSWGYQATGYFSVTSRYGTPYDFKCFVEKLHLAGFGVIMDWVPGHFCKDSHGLYRFDGNYLFESPDERLRENKGWGTANFDFSRNEVHSFMISNAFYWFDVFHIDGIRADAVSNMLYLDYDKETANSAVNKFGGYENLDAIDFLKKLNAAVFEYFPNPLMIAEESSSWPMVTKPVHDGGLGFNFKWNMGWMNDTLRYMALDPYFRKYNHNLITFSLMYAFSENFILSISHDEVVHGKKSLIDKMPGSYEEKFANLKLFYGYMIGHPGKKLLFMGCEFGQFTEWKYYDELEWFLLKYPAHDSLSHFVQKLFSLYWRESALWEADGSYDGFEWLEHDNNEESMVSFVRKGKDPNNFLLFILNFTPVRRKNYKIGITRFTDYEEIFNSDCKEFGGSGLINKKMIRPRAGSHKGKPFHIQVDCPPLSVCILKAKFDQDPA